MAEDWGEKGVAHPIPCQYVSSWLTEILKQAITMQSPLKYSQTCFKRTCIKHSPSIKRSLS